MTWIALIRALIELTAALAGYLERRRLISAGEAAAISEGLRDANDRLTRALDARRAVERATDERLRDDDGHRRD